LASSVADEVALNLDADSSVDEGIYSDSEDSGEEDMISF